MLTLIFLSLAASAKGQYPYPPAVPAVRYAQPVTSAIQPVLAQAGRLQATHFRSGLYPPAEVEVRASPSSTGPYPPAQPVLLAPASTGPYPPAQRFIEGGKISPVEQDSPRTDHTTYSLPSLSSPTQLRGPPRSYPSQQGQFRSTPSSYPKPPYQSAPQQEQFRSAPSSYPKTPYQSAPQQEQFRSAPSSYPKPQYQSAPRPEKFLSSGQPNASPRLEEFRSGGEVSPDELEIPPNSQIKLQDKRLQYSHGFSDDEGTSVKEQGSLLSTNGGWEYVIAKKGSYAYTSPEGKHINVNYIADHNGFRVVP